LSHPFPPHTLCPFLLLVFFWIDSRFCPGWFPTASFLPVSPVQLGLQACSPAPAEVDLLVLTEGCLLGRNFCSHLDTPVDTKTHRSSRPLYRKALYLQNTCPRL
jgi:hypothetical protein